MKTTIILFVVTLAMVSSAQVAQCSDRLLFSFENSDAEKQWQIVNDGVMGGRSEGRLKIDERKTLEFSGSLSLANNGGFASVHPSGTKLGLTEGDVLVARVRGDGREYSLNLYTPERRTAFSYRSKFKTTKDEWIVVRLPLKDFEATWFGRALPNKSLNPSEVNGLGILLADKKSGPFKLEVDWLKAISPSK